MLGTLRLLLAVAVLLSHADVRIYGLNPGVFAVVGFYAISGYVMTGLLRRHYSTRAGIPRYYLDRLLRLVPPYIFVAGLTYLWWLAAGRPVTVFLQREPNLLDLANNLFVVPLNFFMWNGADSFTLIPPGWSLGAEVQFYLIIPVLMLARLRPAALVMSIAVFACAATGLLNSEWFGYRLLPGVLFIFLLGGVLYDTHHAAEASAVRRWWVWWVPAAAALCAAALAAADRLALPYNREVLLGIAVAFPLIHALARRASRPWDEWAGNLAYSVFLNHFLLIWAVFGKLQGAAGMLGLIAASLVFAAFVYRFIEKPAHDLRHRLRRRRA